MFATTVLETQGLEVEKGQVLGLAESGLHVYQRTSKISLA